MKPWFYELISFDKLLLSFHVRLIRVKVLGVILSYGTIRYDETCGYLTSARKTSLPKIIWEEGRKSKSPLVRMARPKFAPRSTSFRGPIAKSYYLPHTWTHPTYDAKRHPDPIRSFSTMHWTHRRTDRRTDRPTDRRLESLVAMGRCARRVTRPKNWQVTSLVYRMTLNNKKRIN